MSFQDPRPASSKKKAPKFASLVFKWGSQVAADAALERQALANRLVRPIQELIRADDGLAPLNQVTAAKQLSVTPQGVQKALAKLIERGHLRVARCRKAEGRPNLYEPLLAGCNLTLVGRGTNSEGRGYQLSVGTDSLPSTFSQSDIEIRRKWARQQLSKHHAKTTAAEIERELGDELFTRLALSGAKDGTWSLSRDELNCFARGLPAIAGHAADAPAPRDQDLAARADHLVLLRLWKVPEIEAKALIDDWYSRVPAQTIRDAFIGAGKRTRGPYERVDWLRAQMTAAILDPAYRVPTRARRSSDGRALREVVAAFQSRNSTELSVDEIAGLVPHIDRRSLRNRLLKFVSTGELQHASHGRYKLRSGAR